MDTVRPAAPDELALLPELERASDELLVPLGLVPLPGPGSVSDLRSATAVLVVGTPPRGFCRLEQVDGRAHLEQLSVHPDHVRRGLGRALLEAACSWAAHAGYAEITLCTFADVAFNAPFYRSAGFEECPGPLPPGLAALRAKEVAEGMDALGRRVVMRRRLTAPAP